MGTKDTMIEKETQIIPSPQKESETSVKIN